MNEFLDGLDEKCRRGEKLYGDDEATRNDVRKMVGVFYGKLFRQAVQIYYFHMLEARSLVVEYALDRAPWWEALLVRALFPLWKRVMIRGLKLRPSISRALWQASKRRSHWSKTASSLRNRS